MRTAAAITWFVAAAAAQQPDPTTTPPSSVEVTQTPPAADAAAAAIPPRFHAPMVLEPLVRDITQLHNSMSVPLVGLGIVTGLAGTGASERGTRQALLNMIRSEHLNLSITDVVAGNTALVGLTAMLPPFAKVGQAIAVKVAVTGDATSLRGGQLLRAELRALDQTYVVVQGPVTTGGFAAAGQNAQVTKNPAGTGWVAGGQVVKDLPSQFWSESGHLELRLLNPSFFNAVSVAAGVRLALADMGLRVEAVDASPVRIRVPAEQRSNENALRILNLAGQAKVRVENPAKVVINQSNGTVLAGEGVLIS